MSLPLPAWLLCACHWSASGILLDSGTDTAGTAAGTAADTATDTGLAPDPWETDDDGDGLSEAQGDCDDADASVHPGATDACDGVDQDCDGAIDEDSADPYEPNDDDPWWLGDLGDQPTWSISGSLANDDDVDRFAFSFDDDWYSSFRLSISLSNIPDGANYRLTLVRTVSRDTSLPVGEVDDAWGDGTLELVYDDDLGPDDGGQYEVWVDALGGADCGRSWLLGIDFE